MFLTDVNVVSDDDEKEVIDLIRPSIQVAMLSQTGDVSDQDDDAREESELLARLEALRLKRSKKLLVWLL